MTTQNYRNMKGAHGQGIRFNSLARYLLFFAVSLLCWSSLSGQDEKDTRPVKDLFGSTWLLNHQTAVVPIKGTFEIDFQHRFGTWDKGYDDFWGIFAPSNMRIGFDYVPIEKVMIGFGFTKDNLLWDFYGKYAVLRQGRSGGSPINITLYGNAAVDTREYDKTDFQENSDRWSLYSELLVARKESDLLSYQLYLNYSWFNFKEPQFDSEGAPAGRDKNGHFAGGVLLRYKLSNALALMAEYDFPITSHMYIKPQQNLGVGLEIGTSAHSFQIFAGNYHALSPQYNSTYNQNRIGDNQFLLGFNITRLWNF